MNKADAALLIFAKAPLAGDVNTRLIPAIGEQAATQLQRDLINYRMQQFASVESVDVQLWCSPDTRHPVFQGCARDYRIVLQQQQGRNLGQRMAHAFQQGLQQYHHVVVIGTDAPTTGVQDVQQAIHALQTHDVVLQPAEDGGYVLIAMRDFYPTVFDDIDWGTDRVLTQTRNNISHAGLRCHELAVAWDIDTESDYLRYRSEFCHDT